MVFKRTVVRSNLHRAICHSFILFYSCCFRENWLTPYSPTTSWSLSGISSEKLSVWCFLFVTLFNLQGTRRIRRNIAILPNFIPFVKKFFQSFFDVQSTQYRSNFLSLTHLKQLVKNFFRMFSTKLFSCACRSRLSADSFVRIPDCSPFVNAFLRSFFVFLISTICPTYPSTTSVQNAKATGQTTSPVL